MQEGVYVAEYDSNGKDVEYEFTFNTNENAEIVINKLNDFGLGDGFSYDVVTKKLYIGDLGNQNLDKINNLHKFALDYGLQKRHSEKVNIGFPGTSTYGETLQRTRNTVHPKHESQRNSLNTLYKNAEKRLNDNSSKLSDKR